ncbi:MAG: DUF2652 domain-containing protein [Paracoccaceae bacterium]|nr:DUF2652 domain-containing protein [Paracoccaceae bacterium]
MLEEKHTYDTIFILPDISNYTSFMTGSRFSTGHAQHIIFCLINAMVEAATRTVELSKLEGDAALFYADARWHSPETIGKTMMDIFAAFFRERERLAASNICNCHACRSIDLLDLKAFVHRGQTTRFTFRGSVDHFGTDVIVIHRIMKNGVTSRRYVIVTNAAADCIDLPGDLKTHPVQELVEHFGQIHATVYEIDDERMAEMSRLSPEKPPSVLKSSMGKLAENLRTLRGAFKRKPKSTGS